MASIPSLKWPLIALAVAGYITAASFIDFTIDIDSASDAAGARSCFPFAVIGLAFAVRFLRKCMRQRQQWRDDKFIETLMKPWPEVPETDWEAYERQLEPRIFDPNDP